MVNGTKMYRPVETRQDIINGGHLPFDQSQYRAQSWTIKKKQTYPPRSYPSETHQRYTAGVPTGRFGDVVRQGTGPGRASRPAG